MASVKLTNNWSTIVSRGVLFSIVWWALTDSSAMSWWFGAPVILLAVTASIALQQPTPFVWYEFLSFLPFFLLRSLHGGADVAWRAFHPSMPIVPDIIEYTLRLPPGLPRVFMANTVSLQPGTLSVSLEGNVLEVHVLVRGKGLLKELEVVEQRVARIFRSSLKLPRGGD